jgi:hypothetical protein
VIGSPEPPLPYTVEKTFTNIQWQQPIFITAEPGTDRLFVIQQGGEMNKPSRILQFRDDPPAWPKPPNRAPQPGTLRRGVGPDTAQAETFLVVSNRLVYSFEFHPGYRTNGYIYLFSNGPTPEANRLNRISRFTVGRQAPQRCDPKSEQVIIEWRSMGHDGGGLVFGHDGMLYISAVTARAIRMTGTGQDLSELNGSILRINVDQRTGRNLIHP